MPDLRATFRATAGDDDRSIWREALSRCFGRRPRDAFALAAVAIAIGAILVNALHLQPGPHPAPIFKIRPRPVASAPAAHTLASLNARPADAAAPRTETASPRPHADIVADVQRELAKRNFYDGPADGISGPKTDAAIRDFIQAAGLKLAAEPNDELLRALVRSPAKGPGPGRASAAVPRTDPIGELIVPSPRRVLAVQRALAESGYGQLKPTGVFGPDTAAAIERFERERKLPITGQISDRLIRELAALTGQPLE